MLNIFESRQDKRLAVSFCATIDQLRKEGYPESTIAKIVKEELDLMAKKYPGLKKAVDGELAHCQPIKLEQ